MARFKISVPAQDDLESILATSEDRWGVEGRKRYAKLLVAALRKIARAPSNASTKTRDEIGPGIRSLHTRHAERKGLVQQPVHVVFFRIEKTAIEIVRVLHERMDPVAHMMPRRRK